jgi:hypothetical protein
LTNRGLDQPIAARPRSLQSDLYRGFQREGPPWERREMTVCIAAICEENTADPKIVLCTDRKISSALGSSEQTLKIRVVG